jgi:hypothetical protein
MFCSQVKSGHGMQGLVKQDEYLPSLCLLFKLLLRECTVSNNGLDEKED